MTYNVTAYIGGQKVNSKEVVIGQKVVYEVLNKYLRNKRNTDSQTKMSKIS